MKAIEDVEPAFEAIARTRPDALLIIPDALILDQRTEIATLGLRHRIAIISTIPELTDVGGMVAYGAPRVEFYRRAGYYVRLNFDGLSG